MNANADSKFQTPWGKVLEIVRAEDKEVKEAIRFVNAKLQSRSPRRESDEKGWEQVLSVLLTHERHIQKMLPQEP